MSESGKRKDDKEKCNRTSNQIGGSEECEAKARIEEVVILLRIRHDRKNCRANENEPSGTIQSYDRSDLQPTLHLGTFAQAKAAQSDKEKVGKKATHKNDGDWQEFLAYPPPVPSPGVPIGIKEKEHASRNPKETKIAEGNRQPPGRERSNTQNEKDEGSFPVIHEDFPPEVGQEEKYCADGKTNRC